MQLFEVCQYHRILKLHVYEQIKTSKYTFRMELLQIRMFTMITFGQVTLHLYMNENHQFGFGQGIEDLHD
jgi:hypothetical protein